MLATVLHLPWLTPALLPSHMLTLFLYPDFLTFWPPFLGCWPNLRPALGVAGGIISLVCLFSAPLGCSSPLDLPAIEHDDLQIYFWTIGENVLNGVCLLSLHMLA